MSRNASRYVLAVLAATVMVGCASTGGGRRAPARVSGDVPAIRVLLAETDGAVEVRTGAGFRVVSGGAVLEQSETAATIQVSASRGAVQFRFMPSGTGAAGTDRASIVPADNADLTYDGVRYDGRIDIVAAGAKMLVLNVLSLEAYLEGVLPHEIGNPGPDAFAALEAQAITARTYAMSRIETRAGELFDVYGSVQDQVYRGKERLYNATSTAIRDTRGVVLTDGGSLASTYYSATCGGHTSDIAKVWPHRDSRPHLHGALDRARGGPSFCSWVHNFRWRYSFSGKEMGAILRRTIPAELGVPAGDVGSLVDMRIVERNPSGRVRSLEIVTTGGTFTAAADRIRWVLKTDVDAGRILPSTMFNLHKTMQNDRLAFVSITGGGNGHGVGMCQNGAIGMARRGYTRGMILAHYYPGTSLERRY